jgi:hypothetical protein
MLFGKFGQSLFLPPKVHQKLALKVIIIFYRAKVAEFIKIQFIFSCFPFWPDSSYPNGTGLGCHVSSPFKVVISSFVILIQEPFVEEGDNNITEENFQPF